MNDVNLSEAVLWEHEQPPGLKQECSVVEKCVKSNSVRPLCLAHKPALALLSSIGHFRQVIHVGEFTMGYIKKTMLRFIKRMCVCVYECV